MLCPQCNKLNPKGSNFCQSCGNNLKVKETKRQNSSKTVTKTNLVERDQQKGLWDKFTSIYDAQGEERQKNVNLTSNEVWELMQRFSTNTFEKFIEDNKLELNKQPYRLIESLKNNFIYASSGGYWTWFAEALLNEKVLSPVKNSIFEPLRKDWEKLVFDDYSKTYEAITDEAKECMNLFLIYRINTFLDSSPTAKDLTNELIDKLKTSLVYNIIWGYVVGIAEENYRN